jgi:hypothetical protein
VLNYVQNVMHLKKSDAAYSQNELLIHRTSWNLLLLLLLFLLLRRCALRLRVLLLLWA